MPVVTAATAPRALPVTVAFVARPATAATGQGSAASPAGRAGQSAAPTQSSTQTPAARIAPASWPVAGAVDLVSHLIGLTETEITYTATITVPDTGADFCGIM